MLSLFTTSLCAYWFVLPLMLFGFLCLALLIIFCMYVRASVRACVHVCVCLCVSVCVCPCSGYDRPVDSVVWININHMLKLMINVYQAGEDTHTVLKIWFITVFMKPSRYFIKDLMAAFEYNTVKMLFWIRLMMHEFIFYIFSRRSISPARNVWHTIYSSHWGQSDGTMPHIINTQHDLIIIHRNLYVKYSPSRWTFS